MFGAGDVADRFEDLLEKERRAILEGNLDFLERAVAEKERLARALGAAGVDVSRLRRLREKLQRNRLLLEAAGRGIRAAAQRLAGLHGPAPELSTYDSSGRRRAFEAPSGKLESRA
jgi:hypothetical protein